MRKWGLPFVACLGLLLALWTALFGFQRPKPPPIPFAPPKSPYVRSIAGSGVIEASIENILIGTPFNDIITDVYVKTGEQVKEGTPLFTLDNRTRIGELKEALAEVKRAEVLLADRKTRYDLYLRVRDRRAVSENDFNTAKYAFEAATADLKRAMARVVTVQSLLDRATVKAPRDGEVLQLNIHKGEIANLNPFNTEALIVFGPVQPLHVRISIDEDDAWRYSKGAPATAFVRGNSKIKFPLQFVRIEPLLVPKQSLTGATSERVDTRVLEVIYSFDRGALPVYVGQILDVFVDETGR
jgi:RND family efflux transporter MFP subunit